jgi:hypothetical protein
MASNFRVQTAPSRQIAAEHAVPAVSKARRQRARSEYLAGILEIQARCARVQLAGVAIGQIAQKVRLKPAVGKKLSVDHVPIEAGHGPAVETDCACGKNEISALQGTIAERSLLDQHWITLEPGPCVSVRRQLRQLFENRVS